MLGRSSGLTDDEVLNLRGWRESDLYGPVDRLVLEYMEEWKLRRRVTDELYRRLTQHFTARQIIDLCFTGGVADLINRFHATFETDLDDETLADEEAVSGTPLLRGPDVMPPAARRSPDEAAVGAPSLDRRSAPEDLSSGP